MSPDFEELVGSDLSPDERARLERVHDLLVAAGPPPDLQGLPSQPVEPAPPVPLRPRRRRGPLLALAAALAVAAFAIGATLVSGPSSSGFGPIAMTGTPAAAGASASLKVFDVDKAGNWPMEMTVTGLAPATNRRPFELWLTRDGKLEALCGSFLTDADGSAVVPMNAPYRFTEYDGWVVVEEGTQTPLLTT